MGLSLGGKKTQNIWRMDAGGGNLKQLTAGKLDRWPVCSPDGHAVFYADAEAKLTTVPLEGGTAKIIAEQSVFSRFDISPDGKLAAFATFHLGEAKEKLELLAIDSGQILKFLDFERPRAVPSSSSGIGSIRFARDGKAVVYPVRSGGTGNRWLQPLDGSPGKQVTDFTSEEIGDFRWSFDSSKFALIRGHTDSDVVLIRPSRSPLFPWSDARFSLPSSMTPSNKRRWSDRHPRPSAEPAPKLRAAFRPPWCEHELCLVIYAGFTFSACHPFGPLTTSNCTC